ncbi:hypothetical protein NLI96_g498 [Meripilus lineatus]|uniref:Uncharacterized protein n=1 Tax=Meripilus lineatus TaxID=2056292 RepID=A0AAD5YJ79_9APHY|nr:hypothetical protein NLI96_g498 [Physisporinus lineatus]
MPVSQETAARADQPVQTPIIDEHAYRLGESGKEQAPVSLPSETAEPCIVETARQQGATQPGSGTEVMDPSAPSPTEPHVPSFKERVIGDPRHSFAKGRHVFSRSLAFLITDIDQPETKEQGQRILRGEEIFEPKKIGPGARRASTGSA